LTKLSLPHLYQTKIKKNQNPKSKAGKGNEALAQALNKLGKGQLRLKEGPLVPRKIFDFIQVKIERLYRLFSFYF